MNSTGDPDRFDKIRDDECRDDDLGDERDRSRGMTQVFVFPGLNGTRELLEAFKRAAPPGYEVTLVEFPDDPSAGYEEFCGQFGELISSVEDCVLIGESWSGPLTVMLARRFPEIVNRVVLVASFVESPMPFYARVIPWGLVFRFPMPGWAVRMLMLGRSGGELVSQVQSTVKNVSSATLAHRVREVIAVDVRRELQELKCLIEYVRPTRDRMVRRASVEAIIKHGKRVSVLETDGPHLILQTNPVAVWELLVIAGV